MLSVWWDCKGILHFELLPRNQTVNSNVYVQQLTKLSDAVQEKRPEFANRQVLFTNMIMQSLTHLWSRQKLLELGWDVLSHPLYSLDLAPSDFHLFCSRQNFLNGKIFNNDDGVKSHLIQFFAGKNQKFYEHGIITVKARDTRCRDVSLWPWLSGQGYQAI